MTDKAKALSRPPDRFRQLLDELLARGLPAPAVLVAGEPLPLALSTRVDLPIWAAAHGYDAEATDTLQSIIRMTVRSAAYQRCLAADLGWRFSLDGEAIEPVSQSDRHSAALNLHARALKSVTPLEVKKAEEPTAVKKVEEPTAVKKPEAASPKRPIIRLGTLSPEETERRRAALAGASR
jgi:hypothetical protein